MQLIHITIQFDNNYIHLKSTVTFSNIAYEKSVKLNCNEIAKEIRRWTASSMEVVLADP
jgi:hypothetical protein